MLQAFGSATVCRGRYITKQLNALASSIDFRFAVEVMIDVQERHGI